MQFRKIALTLFACLALGAFAANAAQAEGTGWTIGTTENQTTAGTLIPNGTHERVRCAKHTGSTLILHSTVLGAPLTLQAEQVDCLEKEGSTNAATIDNTTSPNHSEGVITFTKVKVTAPENCFANGGASDPEGFGEITTKPLTDTVIMDPTNKTTGPVYDKFSPETAGGAFATIKLEGPLCSLKGVEAPVKGTACGEAVNNTNTSVPNKTGTLTRVQTLLFGKPQQETGGCALTAGPAEAQITGAVDNELESGNPFGSD